ncbi:MAG TPA: hypothetical protein DDX29_06875 [Clostridiales bacterium]|nr:hypothetical protein [Clostridiales bacterium]
MKKRIFIPVMLIMMLMIVAFNANTSDIPMALTESYDTEQSSVNVFEKSTVNTISHQNEEKQVTITFTDYDYLQSKWQPIIDQFNLENPNISVEFVPLVSDFVEGIQPSDTPERAMKADTSVVFVIPAETSPYLLDLQPLMDVDSDFQADDFWPAARQACLDPLGRPMGLPLNLSANVIFYDEEVFDQADLATPQPGWTIEDFKTTIDSLNQLAETGYSFADAPFESILQSVITQNISNHGGQLDPQTLESEIDWFIQSVKEGKVYPFHSWDYSDTDNDIYKAWQIPFQSSQPPVLWIGNLRSPYPELSIDPAGATDVTITIENSPFTHLAIDRYGVAPFPVGNSTDAQNSTPVTSMGCAVISAGSQNPQAAWKWINYLTNYWYGENDPLLSNQVLAPSRISVTNNSGYWQAIPGEAMDSVNFALSHSFNAQGLYYEKTQIVYKALDRVFASEITLRDALLEAQAEIAALPEPVLETIQPFVVPSSESIKE